MTPRNAAGIDDETGAISLPDLLFNKEDDVQDLNASIREAIEDAAGLSEELGKDVTEATGQKVVALQQVTGKTVKDGDFPFTLEDLAYWIVKRKDGIVTKYILTNEQAYRQANQTTRPAGYVSPTYKSPSSTSAAIITHFSNWCKHDPKPEPIFEDKKSNTRLHIADAPGMRAYAKYFNLVIDCGQIFKLDTVQEAPTLTGDRELAEALLKYSTAPTPRVLKVDWDDRQAPPLDPSFWTDFAERIKGLKVCTACQGGHGRSGTSLVCLMMVLNKDYTPFDAICHLRAIHCGRAIESKVQHEYINEVGKYLGREENAFQVSGVTDFKAEFLKLKYKSARPYQERLELAKAGKK